MTIIPINQVLKGGKNLKHFKKDVNKVIRETVERYFENESYYENKSGIEEVIMG